MSKLSRQTDQIHALESQLRRLGVTPAGVELEDWEEQLAHGRNAALAALRVWNDPTATFRTETFALLFVTAWNSMALAILRRDGKEWREQSANGPTSVVEGSERSMGTRKLIALAFPAARHFGLRQNADFWIGLRNEVAHRHSLALDVLVIPQAQAGLLNLENVLDEYFGVDYCLAENLSVPLQLSGFRNPETLMSIKKLQASLPLDVQAYLSSQSELNKEILEDPSYMLRVTFIPTAPSSGRNPDAIAHFVKPGEIPEELQAALKDYVVVPKVIRPKRPNLSATQVRDAVREKIPYRFTMPMHTKASRELGARSGRNADKIETDPRYCEFIPAVKRYLYTEAWIERLVDELSTPEGFLSAIGKEPD